MAQDTWYAIMADYRKPYYRLLEVLQWLPSQNEDDDVPAAAVATGTKDLEHSVRVFCPGDPTNFPFDYGYTNKPALSLDEVKAIRRFRHDRENDVSTGKEVA